ncbi:MAG: YabP/YqfC family sporulation protein [Candidatus Coprovivens sp.]
MLLQNIQTFLRNNSYNINISKNNLYINNYNKIDNISENNISIIVDNKKIYIKGNNLKIIKMLDKEILFNGQIESIEIISI